MVKSIMDINSEKLVAPIPHIMVTEASPLAPSPLPLITPPGNTTFVVSSVQDVPDLVIDSSTKETEPVQSSGGFVPAVQCGAEISVPVPTETVRTRPTIDEVANAGTSAAVENDETETLSAERPRISFPRWCPRYGGLFGFYQYHSERLVESRYLLPLQFFLLALPISSGFMAAQYMDECPLSSFTPVLMFMMGILGTIILLSRMLVIIRKALLPTHPEWMLLRMVIVGGSLFLIVLLSTEMLTFLRTSPSHRRGDQNYCHPVFYSFTYWMNWAILALAILVAFVHAPRCTRDSLRNEFPL